jgi:hypothetical protein
LSASPTLTGNVSVNGTYTNGTWLTLTNVTNSWGLDSIGRAARYIYCSAPTATGDITIGPTGMAIGYTLSNSLSGLNQGIVLNGYMGIGTSTPSCPLHIVGGYTATGFLGYNNSYYIDSTGGASYSLSTNPSGFTLSAYFSSSILANKCIVFSDERIKTDIVYIDSLSSLDTITQLKPCTYTYIDRVKKGSNASYGFIAQDVEKVIPLCVNQRDDVIPNIYKKIELIVVDENSYSFEMQDHSIQVGNTLVIINDDEEVLVDITSVTTNHVTFASTKPLSSEVFLYGTQVNDFRVLDSDQILSIAVSAIQGMKVILDELKDEIAALKSVRP